MNNNSNNNPEIEKLVSEIQDFGVRMEDQNYDLIESNLDTIIAKSKELFEVVDKSLAKSKRKENISIFDFFKSPHEQKFKEYEIIDFLIGCVFHYKKDVNKDFLSYAQDRIKRLSGDGLDSDVYLDDLLEKAKKVEDDVPEETEANEKGKEEEESVDDVDEGGGGEKWDPDEEEPDFLESIPDPDSEKELEGETNEYLAELLSDLPKASAYIKRLALPIQIILALTCKKESIVRIKKELEIKKILMDENKIKALQTIIIANLKNELRSKAIDLRLPMRVYWSTANVGTDQSEEPGDCFAWGETRKRSCYDASSYSYDKLVWNGIWGEGWFVPTIEQWRELLEYKEKRWTVRNNVKGMLFKAPNGFVLFLPVGKYWSASSNDMETALSVELNEQCEVVEKSQPRYLGLSIRLVRFDI